MRVYTLQNPREEIKREEKKKKSRNKEEEFLFVERCLGVIIYTSADRGLPSSGPPFVRLIYTEKWKRMVKRRPVYLLPYPQTERAATSCWITTNSGMPRWSTCQTNVDPRDVNKVMEQLFNPFRFERSTQPTSWHLASFCLLHFYIRNK